MDEGESGVRGTHNHDARVGRHLDKSSQETEEGIPTPTTRQGERGKEKRRRRSWTDLVLAEESLRGEIPHGSALVVVFHLSIGAGWEQNPVRIAAKRGEEERQCHTHTQTHERAHRGTHTRMCTRAHSTHGTTATREPRTREKRYRNRERERGGRMTKKRQN